jgi:hypothetical protein
MTLRRSVSIPAVVPSLEFPQMLPLDWVRLTSTVSFASARSAISALPIGPPVSVCFIVEMTSRTVGLSLFLSAMNRCMRALARKLLKVRTLVVLLISVFMVDDLTWEHRVIGVGEVPAVVIPGDVVAEGTESRVQMSLVERHPHIPSAGKHALSALPVGVIGTLVSGAVLSDQGGPTASRACRTLASPTVQRVHGCATNNAGFHWLHCINRGDPYA